MRWILKQHLPNEAVVQLQNIISTGGLAPFAGRNPILDSSETSIFIRDGIKEFGNTLSAGIKSLARNKTQGSIPALTQNVQF